MATKKAPSGKTMGLAGCGTIEQMFKSDVRQKFGKVEGVVGIQVLKDKIVLRVVSEEVAAKLPKTFRRRTIETIVTGKISKRTVK